MNVKPGKEHCLGGAKVSEDGRRVFVTLGVDRSEYEFARSWAEYLCGESYPCTVESELENFLSSALSWHMDQMDRASPAEAVSLLPETGSGRDDGNPT